MLPLAALSRRLTFFRSLLPQTRFLSTSLSSSSKTLPLSSVLRRATSLRAQIPATATALSSQISQVRGMKTRSSVKRLCDGCKVCFCPTRRSEKRCEMLVGYANSLFPIASRSVARTVCTSSAVRAQGINNDRENREWAAVVMDGRRHWYWKRWLAGLLEPASAQNPCPAGCFPAPNPPSALAVRMPFETTSACARWILATLRTLAKDRIQASRYIPARHDLLCDGGRMRQSATMRIIMYSMIPISTPGMHSDGVNRRMYILYQKNQKYWEIRPCTQ